MITPGKRSFGWLPILCLAAGCWATNFGLGAPLASLWLQDAGCSDTIIGVNTGVYYLGIALAAGLVPWLMRRGGRGCVLLGMLLTGLTVAWFPWGDGLVGWFAIRVVNGLGGALSLIPLETLVNQNSPPEQRSRNFGYYAFSVALGMALGNLIGMELYAYAPRGAFLLGGMFALVGGGIILGWLPMHAPPPVDGARGTARLPFNATLLSFGSAWSQGFIEGSMVALLPVYLLAVGWSEASAGWLLSSSMMGVIVSQVPLAWLADRLGRTRVLLSCYVIVVAALGTLMFGAGDIALAVGLFVLGACSAAFYPLGLALLGERVPASGLARASAWYLGINCLGSLLGPSVAGAAMDECGRRALFSVAAVVVLLVLVGWLAVQLVASWGRFATGLGDGRLETCSTSEAATAHHDQSARNRNVA